MAGTSPQLMSRALYQSPISFYHKKSVRYATGTGAIGAKMMKICGAGQKAGKLRVNNARDTRVKTSPDSPLKKENAIPQDNDDEVAA